MNIVIVKQRQDVIVYAIIILLLFNNDTVYINSNSDFTNLSPRFGTLEHQAHYQ